MVSLDELADLTNDMNENDQEQNQGAPPKASHDQLSNSAIEMPADKAYYLQRIDLLQEVQRELTSWAKTRLWWIAAIAVIGGYLGFTVLVKEVIREFAGKAVQEAVEASILARDSAQKAKVVTDQGTKQAETYATTVAALQEKANGVDAQFVVIRQRLQAESTNLKANAEREVKEITTRLARLEKLVTGLATQPQIAQTAVTNYQKDVAEIKAAAFADGKRFAENAKYFVIVYYNEKTSAVSTKVLEKLREAGFKVTSSSKVLVFTSYPSALLTPEAILSYKPSENLLRQKEITVNTIIYDFGAEAKAKEIADLIRPLARVTQIRSWTLGDPSELSSRSSSPTLTSPVWGSDAENRISVFIVEKT